MEYHTLHRQILWDFVKCLSYLYNNREQNNYLKAVILHGRNRKVFNILPSVSEKFHVSNSDIESALLKGSRAPQIRIIKVAGAMAIDPKATKVYNRLKKQLKVEQRSDKIKNKTTSKHFNLKYFIKGIAYYRGDTYIEILNEIGENDRAIDHAMKYESNSSIISHLRQIPFTNLGISKNEMVAILNGDNTPQRNFLNKVNAAVHDRKTLYRYIRVLIAFYGLSKVKISNMLGFSDSHIDMTIMKSGGEAIATVFHRISKLLSYPEANLLKALARANVHSAYHSYVPRMYFKVRYQYPPVGYMERFKHHQMDRARIARGFKVLRKKIHYVHDIRKSYANLRKNIRQIFMGWSHIYGFDADRFIKDNFKYFTNRDYQVRVRFKGRLYAIRAYYDWTVLLRKIHDQLRFVKTARTLRQVQDSPYAPYISCNNFSGTLNHPLQKGARKTLGELTKGRHTFTGKFVQTGIKTISSNSKWYKESYGPTLLLANIKHDEKTVSDSVWFNYTKGFLKLDQLEKGDLIQFKARVHKYKTGHYSKNSVPVFNYELHYPSSMKILRRIHARNMAPMPKDRYAVVGYCIKHNHAAAYDFTYRNYWFIRHCMRNYKRWKRHADNE